MTLCHALTRRCVPHGVCAASVCLIGTASYSCSYIYSKKARSALEDLSSGRSCGWLHNACRPSHRLGCPC